MHVRKGAACHKHADHARQVVRHGLVVIHRLVEHFGQGRHVIVLCHSQSLLWRPRELPLEARHSLVAGLVGLAAFGAGLDVVRVLAFGHELFASGLVSLLVPLDLDGILLPRPALGREACGVGAVALGAGQRDALKEGRLGVGVVHAPVARPFAGVLDVLGPPCRTEFAEHIADLLAKVLSGLQVIAVLVADCPAGKPPLVLAIAHAGDQLGVAQGQAVACDQGLHLLVEPQQVVALATPCDGLVHLAGGRVEVVPAGQQRLDALGLLDRVEVLAKDVLDHLGLGDLLVAPAGLHDCRDRIHARQLAGLHAPVAEDHHELLGAIPSLADLDRLQDSGRADGFGQFGQLAFVHARAVVGHHVGDVSQGDMYDRLLVHLGCRCLRHVSVLLSVLGFLGALGVLCDAIQVMPSCRATLTS